MNKTLFISLYFLTCLSIGCNSNIEIIEIKDYYSKLISDNEPIAIIDFSKNNSLLIKDVESQLKIDLCDKTFLTAQTAINNTSIRYPIHIFKNCENYSSFHNIVSIVVNKDNESIVGDKFLTANSDISKEVIKITDEMMNKEDRTSLLYLFEWDEKSKSEDIKIKLYQILKATKSYSDSISIATFQKPINELNKNQIDSLNQTFFPIISFSDNFESPPPSKNARIYLNDE